MLSGISHSTTSALIKLPDFTACFLPVNLHYLRLPLQLKAITSGAMYLQVHKLVPMVGFTVYKRKFTHSLTL